MVTAVDTKNAQAKYGDKLVEVLVRDGWVCAQVKAFTKDGDLYFPVVQLRPTCNTSFDF